MIRKMKLDVNLDFIYYYKIDLFKLINTIDKRIFCG